MKKRNTGRYTWRVIYERSSGVLCVCFIWCLVCCETGGINRVNKWLERRRQVDRCMHNMHVQTGWNKYLHDRQIYKPKIEVLKRRVWNESWRLRCDKGMYWNICWMLLGLVSLTNKSLLEWGWCTYILYNRYNTYIYLNCLVDDNILRTLLINTKVNRIEL